MHEDLQKVKELFNEGKLTVRDADFYVKRGYQLIIESNKIGQIIAPSDEIKYVNREAMKLC